MKRILFCLQTMVNGGVEKELISILRKLDYSLFDVTLCIFYIDDYLQIKKIPPEVNIVNLNVEKKYWFGSMLSLVKERVKRLHFVDAFLLTIKTLFSLGSSSAFLNIKPMESLQGTYDYAVCYHMHSGLVLRFVIEKVEASIKYLWIHNDVSKSGFDVKRYKNSILKYDKTIAVSRTLLDEFCYILPQMKEKSIFIHNYIDETEILKRSNIKINNQYFSDKRFKILTVGRFVEQKGYELAVDIAKELKKEQLVFSWYFIGWGPLENKILEKISKYDLYDCVYVLGQQDNPFPFMRCCDLYVQTSIHEGYCLTVLEAMLLGKYIISTDFTSIREVINDENDGIVCNERSPRKIAMNIACFYKNRPFKTQPKIINENNNNLLKIIGLFY